MNPKRELGKIESVFQGPEDHDIITCSVHIEFDSGGAQGFGYLALGNLLEDFVNDLCATFNVKNLKDLIGKKCFALRCFSGHNEPIDGLESIETGKKFIINHWRKKHFANTKTTLQDKIESLNNRINSNIRQIESFNKELEFIKTDYTEL